jgi:alpha-1,3-rhamnosyltransferase
VNVVTQKILDLSDAPLVSIAIPSYNHENYIEECILSVINQDYGNIELIIIDDGSTDGTDAIIKRLREKCSNRFVRFEYRTRENKGATATLNEALDWAQGLFFAQLDSDDAILSAKTSTLVRELQNEPDLAGVFSGSISIDLGGREVRRLSYPCRYYGFEDFIFHRHLFATVGQLLRLDAVKAVGGYPDNSWIGDWYMWMALTNSGNKIKSIPDVLAKYRYHPANSSKNKVKMFEARKTVLGFFKNSPLYNIAMAQVCVWAARDFCYISKLMSARCLLQSIQCTKKVICHSFFFVALSGLFVPAWLAKRIPFFTKRFPNLD